MKTKLTGIRHFATAFVLAAILGLVHLMPASASPAEVIQPVDVSLTGTSPSPQRYGATQTAISQDGRYILFQSTAKNLTNTTYPNDGTWLVHLYLRDRTTGANKLIDANILGAPANDSISTSRMTPDGRYVLFSSKATDLTNDGVTSHSDNHIYRYDNLTNTMAMVDVRNNGYAINNKSADIGDISANGNIVIFNSQYGDFDPAKPSTYMMAYSKDMTTGTYKALVRNKIGNAPNGDVNAYAVDCSGTKIVISSNATAITNEQTNNKSNTYYLDTISNKITNLTVGGNNDSYGGSITCSGQYVAFLSYATNIDSDGVIPSSTYQYAYRYDVSNSKVKLASRATNGDIANGNSAPSSISANGKYILLTSQATNLVSPDANGAIGDMLVRDMTNNTTNVISKNTSGTAANGHSGGGLLSMDGKYVVFSSYADNLYTIPPTSGYGTSYSYYGYIYVTQLATPYDY